jgi:hypothetical protein
MKNDKMKMSDAELAAFVEGRVRQSTGLHDGKLSAERASVQRYYDGLEPKPQHAGDSKYVSMDVYDGVEAMKAQLLEVFAGDQTPIAFAPQGADDEEKANEATEACSWVIFRQNGGYEIMRDVIDDSLKGRVGIAKVWWDEDYRDEETKVEDVSYQDFESALMTDPEVELTALELDSETETVKSATMVKRVDTSQVRIELVPPEEFGITKRAKSGDDADIVYHRRGVTADALKRMGVPKDVLKSLKDDSRFWTMTSQENIERHFETDDSLPSWPTRDVKDDTREVDVTEAYVRLDLDGRPAMWMVLVASTSEGSTGRLLLKKKVKRRPFVYYTPLPRPHSFWGSNYAKKLVPTQNARTLLTRSIINHALITNNPRMQVVKGAVMNPKELTDNRIGGVVNVSRPDGILPIPISGLNPFVFQTIQLLDDDKEETTGISKLSQGLNKDAISKQNSGDMVNTLVGLSQTRQKITARNFAEGFLKALYLEVYRLLIENQDRAKLMQIAGNWTEVDPSTWPERDDLITEVSVGFTERDKESQRWVTIDTYLKQDPNLAPAYTPDRRHGVLVRALRAMGVRNTDAILAPPDQWQPQEPDPMQQAELAEKQARAKQMDAQAAATAKDAELKVLEMQHEVRMMEMKAEMERLKLQAETVRHQQKMQMFQMELAAAQTADKTSGILSPDA